MFPALERAFQPLKSGGTVDVFLGPVGEDVPGAEEAAAGHVIRNSRAAFTWVVPLTRHVKPLRFTHLRKNRNQARDPDRVSFATDSHRGIWVLDLLKFG